MKEKVLRFDVPMQDSLFVKISHRFAKLSYQRLSFLFGKSFPISEDLKKLSLSTKLKQKIYTLLIMEKSIELHNILVS